MPTNSISLGVTVDSAGALTKIKGVGRAFGDLEKSAKTESDRIGSHFDGAGDRIARRFQRRDIKTLGSSIANSITALATGGSLSDVAAAAGLAMGVSLATQFVIGAAEKLAGSAVIQALIPVVTAIGTTIGTALSTAAAVAMAIWPALLLAAIVAGIVYLINNPEVVGKILKFAGEVLANLGRGLAKLGEFLAGIFSAAFGIVLGIVKGVVGAIVDSIMRIVDAVKTALDWLGHLNDNKDIGADPIGDFLGGLAGHASGGMVGLHGPEIVKVGERGPEYVVPNNQLGGGGGGSMGVSIVGVSAAQLADMIDRQLYFKLSKASKNAVRT